MGEDEFLKKKAEFGLEGGKYLAAFIISAFKDLDEEQCMDILNLIVLHAQIEIEGIMDDPEYREEVLSDFNDLMEEGNG